MRGERRCKKPTFADGMGQSRLPVESGEFLTRKRRANGQRQTLMAPRVKIRTKRLRTSSKGQERRQQILDWIVFGYSNREIAEKVRLSRSGIAYHVRQLLKHFDAVNRTELAVRYATQERGQ